jgi:hypothetical protein
MRLFAVSPGREATLEQAKKLRDAEMEAFEALRRQT